MNATEHSLISEALETQLGSYLSAKNQTDMADKYGHEIAVKAKAIYEDAIGAPVDWSTANMDAGLAVLHDLLDTKYSWLTTLARQNLIHAFVMCWK